MKNLFLKSSKLVISTIVSLFLCAGIASAHVTVKPNASTTGAWETYTVKVPVEKEIPTTKVTLKMPSGVEFQQYEPVAGWTFSGEKDASGKVTSITWTTTGAGILPGQFQQFTFVAKNPASKQKAAWDAYQYYKDGSIVEWTGAEGSKTPHAITDISTLSSVTGQEDAGTQAQTGNIQTTPMILSVISLVASVGAFIIALRRRK